MRTKVAGDLFLFRCMTKKIWLGFNLMSLGLFWLIIDCILGLTGQLYPEAFWIACCHCLDPALNLDPYP